MDSPANNGQSVRRRLASAAAAAGWLCCFGVDAGEVDFNREILPILSENCFHCHGPDTKERKADLRLDRADGATADLGGGYPALVAGKPEESALIERIESDDLDHAMPPPETGKSLTAVQIETLRQWIGEGAKYAAHWAFQPVQSPTPPTADDSNLTEIDRFVVAALQEKGLKLSAPISRMQLIRRATFDLTGLPPKWKEVEAFDNDPRPDPDAFKAVVDRLLDSPAYGARWGRHWLDLARYADTQGASAIGFVKFPFSYTYRDYVIAAFNANLPYDRFLLEQIAADQLNLKETDPALAALGFLTVGRQFRNVHDRLDDQIDVITRGLLGMTVSCARCHDHKFDPIPTTDYYSLYATLSPSRAPTELPLVGSPEVSESYQSELKKRKRLSDDIVKEHGDVLRGRLKMQVGMYLGELAKGTPEQDTSTFFLSFRTEDLRPIVLERWRSYLKTLDETDPVFGPWHRLSRFEEKDFATRCQTLAQELTSENGDPKKFAEEHKLATAAPKWNPRVLEALAEKKPKSFVEAADVYGDVFADAWRRWLNALLEASAEAAPDGNLVPDQDSKHRVINSAIERQLRHHLLHPDSPTAIDFDNRENFRMINRGVRDSVSGTLGAIDNLNRMAAAPPRAMILQEAKKTSGDSFVFLRGNPIARGERVEPRFLSALSGEERTTFPEGERRLGLARSIVDPANPLTRRVIANWVWQHHFDHGLVRTADDFGTRGDPPSHPELLDYLAEKLLEDDWSLKKLHRRIMLSKVYQQAAREIPAAREKDPENRLLWRMPVRKLKLEAMRDALLAVSGELDPTPGGRPFEEKDSQAIPRRSVYAFVNRDVISKMASTFDGADPSACTVKRSETMVPQQTLYALNSNFIQARAKALVALPEVKNAESDEARVQLIYRKAYSRPPEEEEMAIALNHLKETGGSNAAWVRFVHVLLASNEFHFID